jgi:8-oxo-dGTP diphosphatase
MGCSRRRGGSKGSRTTSSAFTAPGMGDRSGHIGPGIGVSHHLGLARAPLEEDVELARFPELNYCPCCGHALENREAFGRARRFCPACDRIVFRDLKVAAGVIVERGGEVLLARRRMQPGQGKWTFPAGFVDFDEDPASAAVRECLEETGLEVEITGLLDVIAGREHEHGADIIIVYCARLVGGELQADDDVDEVAFFAPDEDALPPLAFHATQVALDKWHKDHE